MKQQDLLQLAKYSDKYVAYVGDILHVVASGASMSEVQNILQANKITVATITYIPPVHSAITFTDR